MLTSFFSSKLSKIYIKGSLVKPFYVLYPWKTHATQAEFPSSSKREPKTPQRGKKADAKELEALHSEEEGNQLSLLQRGKGSIYLPNSTSSFEFGPKLRLSPKMPPKRKKPP